MKISPANKEILAAIESVLPDLDLELVDPSLCLYQAGYADSFEVLQITLEIQSRFNVQLDIEYVLEHGLSLSSLQKAVSEGC